MSRDTFDITPAQYHNGLDKLWRALKVDSVQEDDVFTICAERIAKLEAEKEKLRKQLKEMGEKYNKCLKTRF